MIKQYKIQKEELWDLEYAFCLWIVPRLKAFKTMPERNGRPGRIRSFPEWERTLTYMIEGFEEGIKKFDTGTYDEEKLNNASRLFGKHLKDLWD